MLFFHSGFTFNPRLSAHSFAFASPFATFSLDKENVLSYFRVDPTMAMKDIDHNEIEEWLSLIGKLYKTCFGAELPRKSQMPSKDDIIYTFFWR